MEREERIYRLEGADLRYIRLESFERENSVPVSYTHLDVYKRQVNVVIRGLKEDLDQLSAAALGAEMDVEDMVPGENSGEITFQLGDAYELVSYDRIQVTVTEKGPSADSTAASTNCLLYTSFVAINQDESAPIFNIADYGMTCDMKDVLEAYLKL